jgi:hypothetical protein
MEVSSCLQLRGVGHGPAQVRRQLRAQLDGLRVAAAQHLQDRPDDLVDVDGLQVKRLSVGENEHLPDQGGAIPGCLQRPASRSRFSTSSDAEARTISIELVMTVNTLLKSCAMPPVSWPNASIFWA